MQGLVERLEARWIAQGLAIRPGVSSEEIEAFEARYGVTIAL